MEERPQKHIRRVATVAPSHCTSPLLAYCWLITPQQFLESFLQEKAAAYSETNTRLRPVYAKYFGEPLSKNANEFLMRDPAQAAFDDVKLLADSAIVITREPAPLNTTCAHGTVWQRLVRVGKLPA
jgi:hypothetical protein